MLHLNWIDGRSTVHRRPICTDNSRIFSIPEVLQPSNGWQLPVFQEMVPHRPIDIDRSPFMMENRRVNGGLKVPGTLTGRRLGRGSARVESGEETAGA